MYFDRKDLTNEQLEEFYRSLLLPRMIEEKMLILLRQGKVSKWFSGIGQEAIAVGATLALDPDEWIMPLHRNLGVFTTREMPLDKLIRQWQGSYEGYSKGRERSFHFGSREHYICGMISHLGPQLAIADGVALDIKLKNEKKVALAFSGEGGTSEGDFHEALNVAAVWGLPVIFLIENNGYALSTPAQEQFRNEDLVEKARGYGMEGVKIDGNNILTVYDTIKGVRQYCIDNSKPFFIECTTFRMRGHEEASGTKYVPPYLFEIWEQKDPVKKFENYLRTEGVLNEELVQSIHEDLHHQVEEAVQKGFDSSPIPIHSKKELADVYAPSIYTFTDEPSYHDAPEKSFIDAIREGLEASMDMHPDLVLMGQDIAAYGGAFKITEGFMDKYGKERVRNTPLCESAILGAALGLSIRGRKSMVEMQFADFITAGFNQVVNNLAKIHYRWGQNADVVIRMPTGAGVGAGPFHSQSNEAWFFHTPGLKIVYPSNPEDAKGLLIAAFNDPNPVLYFEHKALYRKISGPVPASYYETPIGKAAITTKGSDITIITYGMGVHWALDILPDFPEVSIEIIDLRTLMPIDWETIEQSVKKTGKALVLHEDTLTGGIGGEIASWIGEHCFEYLDAPVLRCASLDTPVPFNPELEKNFLAFSRLHQSIQRLLEF